MEAVAVRLSLFVLNPRLFLELKSLLEEHGVEFRVPAGLSDLCFAGELLVVDPEGLKYVSGSGAPTGSCSEVVAVSSSEEVYSAVLSRVLGGYSPISIGIDLGKRIAYAVLASGRLLTYGYADRAEEIKNLIERLSRAGPRTILLGVGAQYLKGLPDDIASVIEDERVTAAYIVEEGEASRVVTPSLAGESVERLPEDVRASIAIAVKAFERHALARASR